MHNIMMKLVFIAVFTIIGLTTRAQEFNGGISLGLPIGNTSDGWLANITLDLNHLWKISDAFEVGMASGYSHTLGDQIGTTPVDVLDFSYVPLALAVRLNISDNFTLGADLGYAIGIDPKGNDGGFYYAPKIQYRISDDIDIVAAYRGVSLNPSSFDVITIGIEFVL